MSGTLRLKTPPAVLPLALEQFLAVERARTAPTASTITVEPTRAAPPPAAEAGSASPLPAAERIEADLVASRRRAELKVTERLLRDLAPRAFLKPARPLKIGICNDLIDLLAGEVAPIAVRRFLGCWCRRDAYLRALAYGGARFDLDGAAVGTVTEEQQARARRLIEERGADL